MILLTTVLSAIASPAIVTTDDASTLVWDDAVGRNTLTWNSEEAITVTHSVLDDGKRYWYRQLAVTAPVCDDGDQTFAMADDVEVSDADGDGIGEVSFAIRSGCTTDASAVSLDLYLWEDGAMHQLWGETVWWNFDGTGTVTPPQLSDSLAHAPDLTEALSAHFEVLVRNERSILGGPVVLHFVDDQR
ncbi:MAG: hypothetical protein ACI8RZ_004175 [Myxococcota bacterium]|jgi:hypothetical protein